MAGSGALQSHAIEEDGFIDCVPPEISSISDHISLLTVPKADPTQPSSKVYLLGTAHVSKKSAIEAYELVHKVKPDCVVLELCKARVQMLTMQEVQQASLSDILKQWMHHKRPLWGLIYGWAVSQVASKLEVMPGEEFRTAYKAAKELEAAVVLGDRPVQITLTRTWAALDVRQKVHLLWDMLQMGCFDDDKLAETIEQLKDSDMLTKMIEELSEECPPLRTTLITERDLYLTHTLRNAAMKFETVVAVVGAGHCPGIREHWADDIDVERLLELPPQPQPSLLKEVLYEWRWNIAASATIIVGSSVVLVTALSRRR